MHVDVSEMRALANDFRAAIPRVQAGTIRVVRATGFDTVARAQVAAPVDTGTLKSSITVSFGGGDTAGFVAGPEVNYGRFVEEGTEGPYEIPGAFGRPGSVTHPGISAQPYMAPAFRQAVERAHGALVKIAGDVL